MTKIEHIRQLTQAGKAKAQRREAKERKALQNKLGRKKASARAAAKTELVEIIKVIEKAARAGSNRVAYHVGESSEYISCLAQALKEMLSRKGFSVSVDHTTHTPFGSDPYRWDTYTDVDLDITW